MKSGYAGVSLAPELEDVFSEGKARPWFFEK